MGNAVAAPQPVENVGNFRLQRNGGVRKVVAASCEIVREFAQTLPALAERYGPGEASLPGAEHGGRSQRDTWIDQQDGAGREGGQAR